MEDSTPDRHRHQGLIFINHLKLAASRINTGTEKMKLFEYVFEALGTTAAIAIALGAYWHIFTLGTCALMVWSLKEERKKNK